MVRLATNPTLEFWMETWVRFPGQLNLSQVAIVATLHNVLYPVPIAHAEKFGNGFPNS